MPISSNFNTQPFFYPKNRTPVSRSPVKPIRFAAFIRFYYLFSTNNTHCNPYIPVTVLFQTFIYFSGILPRRGTRDVPLCTGRGRRKWYNHICIRQHR